MRIHEDHERVSRALDSLMNGMFPFVEREMKAAYKDKAVPEGFWDDFFETLITDDDLSALIEEILPVYDNHFTHQEIKDLIATFDSPAYRKWVQQLPAMMQESAAIGRQWGQRFGESGVVKERIKQLLMKYEMDDAPLQQPELDNGRARKRKHSNGEHHGFHPI